MPNLELQGASTRLRREIRAKRNHPGVVMAGASPLLDLLDAYLHETEARLRALEDFAVTRADHDDVSTLARMLIARPLPGDPQATARMAQEGRPNTPQEARADA
jgi:hypothetical protein